MNESPKLTIAILVLLGIVLPLIGYFNYVLSKHLGPLAAITFNICGVWLFLRLVVRILVFPGRTRMLKDAVSLFARVARPCEVVWTALS